MKDFVRQASNPEVSRGPAIKDSMEKHISRFRFAMQDSTKSNSPKSLRASKLQSYRPLRPIPKEDSSDAESSLPYIPLVESPQKGLPLALPIDSADNNTMAILEYYHTGFWGNAFAGNPEGIWLAITLSDPALFHANVCLVAQHRRLTRNVFDPKSYYWHRGEAMRIISSRLMAKYEAINDTTIGAVAILSNSDEHGLWADDVQQSHIDGLAHLVQMRGGLAAMTTSEQIKRVVRWADLLHAISHDQQPRLLDDALGGTADREVLTELGADSSYNFKDQAAVPPAIDEFLKSLRTLSATKSGLLLKRDKKICKLFSSLLTATEMDALKLTRKSITDSFVLDDSIGSKFWSSRHAAEAFKSALTIFTLHDLRDLAQNSVVFHVPTQKLLQSLQGLLDLGLIGNPDAEQVAGAETVKTYSYTDMLLWMLLQAWKATGQQPEQREWAAGLARQVCADGDVANYAQFAALTRRVLYSREHCPQTTRGLWKDVGL